MVTLLTATWGRVTLEASVDSDKVVHPNELNFQGVMLILDEASTKPPNGARGHRILVPKLIAQKRLDTLLGMGVNLSSGKDSHAPQRKIGVIKKAWIKSNELWISGTIWKKDFPDAEKALKSKDLGMSFEGSDVQIEDPGAHIWTVKDLIFTGAALLLKTSAAYFKTEALAASAMFAELFGAQDGGAVMAKIKVKEGTATAFDPKVLAAAISSAISGPLGSLASAMQAQTAAISSMHASFESSQTDMFEMLAKGKKPKDEDEDEDSDEDEDDDEDSDDEDDEDSDDEEDVEARKVKAKKIKAKSDIEEGADDADTLENLEDEDTEDDETPGKMNPEKNIANKGNKTTVTASTDRLRKVVTQLLAEKEALTAQLKVSNKKLKAQASQIEAAASKISRRSATQTSLSASSSAAKPSALFSGLLDKYAVSAAGDKITMAEFNEHLNAEGITDTAQRLSLKIEAERNGTIYTSGEGR